MGGETTLPVQAGLAESARSAVRPEPSRAQLIFQFGLFCLVATSIGRMFGAEPATTVDYALEVIACGTAAFVSVAAWLASSRFSPRLRLLGTIVSLFLILLIVSVAVVQFALSDRVLEPAIVQGDRILHRALGLSYARLPHSKINVEPAITRQNPAAGPGINRSGLGLKYGETAVISRMTQVASSHEINRAGWSVLLEIQRDRITDLNALIMNVRQNELTWSKFPNIRIIRPTRLSYRHGISMVEFDFVEQPQGLLSRQVYLRRGPFILNFMLNSERASDYQMFEDFLNSLEFQSSFDFGTPASSGFAWRSR